MRRFLPLLVLVAAAPACHRPARYTTTVEVLDVQSFGQDPKSPAVTELELRFVDCPGDARKIVRGDKAFGPCGAKLKKGDRVPAELVSAYNAEKLQYRSDVVKLAGCDVGVDPKDEANYEIVQRCEDLKATGASVGVHCDRRRGKELIDKCPWFRR